MDEQIYQEINNNEERFWWFLARRSIVHYLLKKYVETPQSKTVLDVGCGTGMMAASLAGVFGSVIAADMEASAVEIALQKGLNAVKGFLPDGMGNVRADVVLLLDVLEHIEQDAASVSCCHKLLNENGILLATVPAYPFLWSDWDVLHHHKRRYKMSAFKELFSADLWKCELVSHYNTLLAPPAFAVRLLGQNDDTSYTPPPAPLNMILKNIFAFEKHLLPKIRLPFGLSIIGLFRKR